MPVSFPPRHSARGFLIAPRLPAGLLGIAVALSGGCADRAKPSTRLAADHPASPAAEQAPPPPDSEFVLAGDPISRETNRRLESSSVPAPRFGGSGTMRGHSGHGAHPAAAPAEPPAEKPNPEPRKWRSSMNPDEVYDHPGKDSMGMELIPIETPEPAAEPRP